MNRFHLSAPFSKGDRRNSPITRRPGRDETRVNCLRPPLDDVAIASVRSHYRRRVTSAQPDRADRTTRPTPGEFRSVARPSTPLAHDSQHRQVTQRVQFSRGRQPTVGRHRPKISLSMKKKFASRPGVLTSVTRPFSDAALASGGSTRRTRCRPDRPSRSTARRPDRCRCASRRDSRGGRLRPVGRRRREERCRSAVGSSSASA